MLEAKQSHLAGLTGLRGIAALWVFAYHIFKSFAGDGAGAFTNDAIPFLREGWRGVDLFFILSGFVIAHVHLRDFERPAAAQLQSYMLRRFRRVYPLNAFWHVAVLLLFFIAPSVLTGQPRFQAISVTGEAFWAGIFLVQSWIPGYTTAWNWPSWSLSAEIAAYLLFPLMAIGTNLLLRPAQAWVLAALAIATLAVVLSMRGALGVNAAEDGNAILRAVFCFAAGVALCRALSLAPLSAGMANGLALAGLALGALGCIGNPWNYMWIPASALLIAAASSEGAAANLLSKRAIHRLGEVSFSLYLSHWPVTLMLRAQLVARGPDVTFAFALGALLTTIAMTVAVTYLSWRYLEAPMHRYGRKVGRGAFEPASA